MNIDGKSSSSMSFWRYVHFFRICVFHSVTNCCILSVIQILFTEFYDQLYMKYCVHAPDFIKLLCNKGKDLLIFHLLSSFLLY